MYVIKTVMRKAACYALLRKWGGKIVPEIPKEKQTLSFIIIIISA